MDGDAAYCAASNIIKCKNITDVGDIMDFDNYYKYTKNFHENSPQKYKSVKKSQIFPNEIKELIHRRNFEFDTLDNIEIRTVDSYFPYIDEHLGNNLDNIKQFIINCFTFANSRKRIDIIIEILDKFLSTKKNNYDSLFRKAIIESMSINSKIFDFHLVIRELSNRGLIDLKLNILTKMKRLYYDFPCYLYSCELKDIAIVDIIKKDALNEFIEFTSLGYDLSSKICFEKFNRFKKLKCFKNKALYANKKLLISIAAFYSSVSIFKYLYINTNQIEEETFVCSVEGGNVEIFRLLLQKENYHFNFELLEIAILYHNNEIADWIYENLDPYEQKQKDEIIQFSIEARNLYYFLNHIDFINPKRAKEHILTAIYYQSLPIFKILDWIDNNNSNFQDEIECACVCNNQAMIKHILFNHIDSINYGPLFLKILFKNIPFSEVKSIVSLINHLDESFDLWSDNSIFENYISFPSLNFISNILGFGVGINKFQFVCNINLIQFHNIIKRKISLLSYSIIKHENDLFNALILIPGIDVNQVQISPLLVSAIKNNIEAFKILINHPQIVFTKNDITTIIQTKRSDEIIDILKSSERIKDIYIELIEGIIVFRDFFYKFRYLKILDYSKIVPKDAILSNGVSFLVKLILFYLDSDKMKQISKLIDEMVNDGYSYVNCEHINLTYFFLCKKVKNETKKKIIKMKGFSALDIMEYGSNEMVYSMNYVNELLDLEDLNIDSIFDKIVRKAACSANGSTEILIKALNHKNLSVETVAKVYFDAVTEISNNNLYIIKLLLRYRDGIIRNYEIYGFIKGIVKKATDSCVMAANFRIFKYIIGKKLFIYDQFIHYFKHICFIYFSPLKLRFLMSEARPEDLEFCINIAVHALIKNIERVKDFRKYNFLFSYPDVDYSNTEVVSMLMKQKNVNVIIHFLSVMLKETKYFSDGLILHTMIKNNANEVVEMLCSFPDINLRMKDREGHTSLHYCKICNNKEAYRTISKRIREMKND